MNWASILRRDLAREGEDAANSFARGLNPVREARERLLGSQGRRDPSGGDAVKAISNPKTHEFKKQPPGTSAGHEIAT